ncbi:MAG: 16S rRNA (adenine(1518)-N(6)/adenine(1519)-N(6))-dimethyltransferase RsmA [Neisseriaceae bacterium]|nr:MAG: 16S rRNA (adenine(1518)-N(6)/adenine(1519)-N(6))-dimethyltransferase RsmA [Neisseriaceae bacterium]
MKYKAKKRFGQNFLQDTFLIQHILQSISPTSFETLVEIGPGLGALTAPLSQTVKTIHVIEIDNDIVNFLSKQTYSNQLVIHHQDVLNYNFNELPSPQKIIGNLPYNISTPLLFKLTNYINLIESMFFMLQKEVAERLIAQPGSSQFGRLSVLLQYYFNIEIILEIPPTAFKPVPKVDSAFIRMLPNQGAHGKVNNWEHFSKLVKQSFSMKRKTIFNNLKSILEQNTLLKLNINPTLRPEELSIEQYVLLSNYLESKL